MPDLILGNEHKKMLDEIAEKFETASWGGLRGYRNASIRLAIETLHHILKTVPMMEVMQKKFTMQVKK